MGSCVTEYAGLRRHEFTATSLPDLAALAGTVNDRWFLDHAPRTAAYVCSLAAWSRADGWRVRVLYALLPRPAGEHMPGADYGAILRG